MRDDLEARFLETARRLKQLRTSPPLETRLLLWKLHRQATYGDYDGAGVRGRALAGRNSNEEDILRRGWGELKGTPKDAAMWLYLQLADTIRD
ncbi:acyl-CoA-binding protein [Pseudomonas entomophila]|uniref:acyl-CoA-binding domain-containing protein n=1 Tax=Pseudomonas entomophila TaxID=312306 RepID=UPI001BCB7F60|nr:acyl-CoA-binding protein [Pseudomonas entomophila]QVM89444.1 acyl-CoA-binding protein [Pseudomonas entomophila]